MSCGWLCIPGVLFPKCTSKGDGESGATTEGLRAPTSDDNPGLFFPEFVVEGDDRFGVAMR
jgi:hypothetical protein